MLAPKRIGTLHGFAGAETDFDFLSFLGAIPRETFLACPYIKEGFQLQESTDFWDRWGSWFSRWITDRGITHLIGYSMGGRFILQHLTRLDLPKTLRKVILIGASLPIDSPDERKKRLARDKQWVQLIKDQGVAVFLKEWKHQSLLASQENIPEPLKTQLLLSQRSLDPKELLFSLNQFSPAKMPSGHYHATPVVAVDYIYGEKDTKYKLVAKNLKSRYPGIQVHEIPNAGHAAHWENPTAFLGCLSLLW